MQRPIIEGPRALSTYDEAQDVTTTDRARAYGSDSAELAA